MKIIATAFNIGLLALLGYILNEDGIPKSNDDALFCLLIFLTPISNLYLIYFSGKSASENILSLYFKRKALEEKQKIAALQKKDSSATS